MVTIQFDRSKAGQLVGFSARGHALFAEEGQDIVCAGVAALLQTAVLGLEVKVGVAPRYRVQKGRLTCRVDARRMVGETGRHVDVLLETMLLGLTEMARHYPEHMRVQVAPPPGSSK